MSNIDRYNLFPINLGSNASLRYRVWSIEPTPTTPALREKIRSFLWQKQLRRPVAPMYVDGIFSYAVADWGKQAPITYDAGERRFTITATEENRTIQLNNISDIPAAGAELASAMIQQELNLHLRKHPQLVPGFKNGQFYELQSDTVYAPRKHASQTRAVPVDIYRGFNFRIIHIKNAGFCLALDIVSSYIGKESLAQYWRRNQNPEGLDNEFGLGRWAYDCGNTRQSVYVIGKNPQSIGNVALSSGQTVYEYLCRRYPEVSRRITPHDPTATMIYNLRDERDESKHYSAAATLLRPKLATHNQYVRDLGDVSAFPSVERWGRIEHLRSYFQGARFTNIELSFGQALEQQHQYFLLPTIRFGSESHRIDLQPNIKRDNELHGRKNWGREKLSALAQYGPFQTTPFSNPHFVYPASFENTPLFKDFLSLTQKAATTFGHISFNPRYSPYRDNAGPQEIVRKLESMVGPPHNCGFALVALPPNQASAQQIYAGVKSRLAIPTKCFSLAKLRSQAERGRHNSYIDRNTLAMLVENDVRPWVLSAPLNYELHIGIDVARLKQGGLLGMSSGSGDVSENIVFRHKEIARRELIPEEVIRRFVFERLEEFLDRYGRGPQSVMFQRDGRFWGDEYRGITAALRRFAKKYADEALPTWAAVSIEKTSSVPLRIFRDNSGSNEAAFSGTYFVQNDRLGFLVTAGAPSLPQGTPRPLQVSVVEGSADIIPVMADIFHLAQLNYSSPETDIRLPITLKVADQMLERYAIKEEFIEEEDDDEWE